MNRPVDEDLLASIYSFLIRQGHRVSAKSLLREASLEEKIFSSQHGFDDLIAVYSSRSINKNQTLPSSDIIDSTQISKKRNHGFDEIQPTSSQINRKKQKTVDKPTTISSSPALIKTFATATTSVHKKVLLSNRKILPIHKYILAPMVGASELPFRLLCRRYGVQLAYTPMMSSEIFAVDSAYRESEFQTVSEDRPLVAHFSANDPDTFLQAAKFVEHKCDAIDLNLGCPQRIAYTGHFGSYLLDDIDRPLILNMIEKVSQNISIPLFVKIRLLDTVEETIKLCFQLVDAGASLIAIHGRYRVNLVGRTGAGARDGAAHLDQIAMIKSTFLSSNNPKYMNIPIITNGNVITWNDVRDNLKLTKANGIMSAEGLLDDPALFIHANKETQQQQSQSSALSSPVLSSLSSLNTAALSSSASLSSSTTNDNNATKPRKKPSKLSLAQEYLTLVEQYPATLKTVIFHIRRMCKEELTKYQLMESCLACSTVNEIKVILDKMSVYVKQGERFVLDQASIKKAKELLERKKREENKRKEFEKRMMRKAKREGKPMDHYLSIGAAVPSQQEIEEYRLLSKEQSFQIWKEKHSQHCYAYHIYHHDNMEQCDRDKTCAFLHSDVVYNDEADIYG